MIGGGDAWFPLACGMGRGLDALGDENGKSCYDWIDGLMDGSWGRLKIDRLLID